MTLENLKKHHAHLKWLASGDFTERDFDFTIDASENEFGKKGEAGRSAMGDMKHARRELIMQDAQRTLKIFESKYPEFKEVEKVSVKDTDEKETKSKVKK